jgi:DNA-binding NarL/FixJ family response regulator
VRELELIDELPRYLARGISPHVRPEAAEGLAPLVASDELLVCDAQGRIVDATDGSRTMLVLASGVKLDAEGLASAQHAVHQELRQLCRQLARYPDPCRLSKRTRWGDFSIEARRLSDAARAGPPRVAMHVRRHEPAQLRGFDAAGLEGDLSERQREIALQVSLGRSNADIGATLCLSANTVSYHVKSLFAKFGVHSRAALTRKLVAR